MKHLAGRAWLLGVALACLGGGLRGQDAPPAASQAPEVVESQRLVAVHRALTAWEKAWRKAIADFDATKVRVYVTEREREFEVTIDYALRKDPKAKARFGGGGNRIRFLVDRTTLEVVHASSPR